MLSAGSGVTASRLIVVAGATGAGKSLVALELAKLLGGEIVSLDSVAVYRGMDIGSAKPDQTARALVKHHLIDVLNPDQQINAAHFIELANSAIADIQARQKAAIIVGGSSMYLTALLYGLAALPPAKSAVRAELADIGTPQLYRELQRLDPSRAAKLHSNDRVRIERALESARLSEQVPSELLAQHGNRNLQHAALCFCICSPRVELYAKIDARVEAMLAAGLVSETEKVIAQYGIDAPALKAIGYAEVTKMLTQKLNTHELAHKISQSTRRFAKRQLTFWRNEPVKRGWKIEPIQTWPRSGGGKMVFPDFNTSEATFSELKAQACAYLSACMDDVQVRYVNIAAC